MAQHMFSESDVQVLQSQRYHTHPPKLVQQLDILWLLYHGLPRTQIATLTACSRSTVQRVCLRFRQHGLPAFLQPTPRVSKDPFEPHRDFLRQLLIEHPPHSVKQAQPLIWQHLGIKRGLTQVRLLLKSLGFQPRRVAAIPLPPKTTVAEHAQRQETFRQQELEPRLAEARAAQRQVYFVDAAHFVHGPFVGLLWCLCRLFVRAASGRKRFHVLGALHAVSHRLVTVTNPNYINAASVCDWLRALAQAALPGIPITLVLDNARYQKGALVAQLGVELLYLPAYSPNLNLIERLWKFVKKECLRNRTYETYSDFHTAIQQCLDDLPTKHHAALQTLLTHKFQAFDDVSIWAA